MLYFTVRNIHLSNDCSREQGDGVASKRGKAELIEEVASCVRRMQTDQDLFDDLAAARLGVNRTDLRVMDVVHREGSMPAGRLAELAGLSPPALTAAVDRLARAGYARRRRGGGDRRQVTIELTRKLERRAEEIWGPMGADARTEFGRWSVAELELILRFLQRSERISAEHRRRLTAED
jgi:DNA-binding MarR family transcriptional regulator